MKRRQQRNKRFAYKQLLTHSHIRGQIYAEREIKGTYVITEKERNDLQLFNEHTMTYWSFILYFMGCLHCLCSWLLLL